MKQINGRLRDGNLDWTGLKVPPKDEGLKKRVQLKAESLKDDIHFLFVAFDHLPCLFLN